MAYESVKNFVVGRLGSPRVKVYLTSEQLDDCIWEAINRWMEYNEGIKKRTFISGTQGNGTYPLPPQIVPRFIIDVVFKPSDPLLSLTGVMQDVYVLYYLQNAGGASNFIVDYWMTLASYEEYVRVLGNQPHWTIIDGDKLRLDPIPSTDFQIGIDYSEVPPESYLENIRWIRLYTLALAKGVEGEIRSKFSSFQAGSGEISLNGDALKAESVAEQQKLEEELFNKAWPLGMVVD
jgi:hypothetical protein